MGFLSMCGLMKAEEHNRMIAAQKKQVADAAKAMEGEDFVGIPDHTGQVGLTMARLRAARTRVDKVEAEIKIADNQTKAAISARDEALKHNADLAKLVADMHDEIARLKPLAEATERRRANDAKRVRPSRAKKTPAAGKAAPKAKAASIKAPR